VSGCRADGGHRASRRHPTHGRRTVNAAASMVEAVGRGRGLYDLQEARVKLADQEKFAALLVPGTDFGDPIGAGIGEKGKRALTIGWQTFQFRGSGRNTPPR